MCCNSEINTPRASCSVFFPPETEVKLICGKLFPQFIATAYHDIMADSVEGLKSYSMFCLYMTG